MCFHDLWWIMGVSPIPCPWFSMIYGWISQAGACLNFCRSNVCLASLASAPADLGEWKRPGNWWERCDNCGYYICTSIYIYQYIYICIRLYECVCVSYMCVCTGMCTLDDILKLVWTWTMPKLWTHLQIWWCPAHVEAKYVLSNSHSNAHSSRYLNQYDSGWCFRGYPLVI